MRWLIILTLTTACTAIVPDTARKLSRLDPLSADPTQMAVSLDLPPGIGVQPGGMTLSLAVENPERGSANGTWSLAASTEADGTQTFRIASRDIADVRRVQATAAQWETDAPDDTNGSLSVAVDPCRTAKGEIGDAPRLSVFIQLAPDDAMMPLMRDVPVQRFLSEDDLAALPDCRLS